MDVLCPQGSHREDIYPLAAIAVDEALPGGAGDNDQRELEQLLGMPQAPREPEPHHLGCFAYFQVIAWLLLSSYLVQRLVETRSWTALIISLVLLSLVIIAEIGMYRRLRSQDKRQMADYIGKQQAWRAAREEWERLFYCKQHRIVFDPARPGETCEPGSLIEFLGLGRPSSGKLDELHPGRS